MDRWRPVWTHHVGRSDSEGSFTPKVDGPIGLRMTQCGHEPTLASQLCADLQACVRDQRDENTLADVWSTTQAKQVRVSSKIVAPDLLRFPCQVGPGKRQANGRPKHFRDTAGRPAWMSALRFHTLRPNSARLRFEQVEWDEPGRANQRQVLAYCSPAFIATTRKHQNTSLDPESICTVLID